MRDRKCCYMDKIRDLIKNIGEQSSQLLMFYAIVFIEMLAMLLVVLLQIIMHYETNSNVPLFLGVAYLFVILLFTNRYQDKLELLKMMALIPTLLGIITYLYMGTAGGGIKSGMPIWMVLGLLMVFLFIRGVYFAALFSVTLLEYRGCIIYTYLYSQDKLGKLEESYYYQDNIIAIVAVAVSLGVIIKYQQLVEDRSKQRIEQEKLKAQNANEAKTNFLTNMSHDIRTPMNAIIGMTEMADYNIDDTDKVRECLKKIKDSSTMLLHLINNVLDMSEIENHELKLKEAPFKLREIVESLQAVLEQTAADKQLALEVRCEQIQNNRLIGDAVRLKQVMMNLASNSLKFTPPGGKVSLAITEEESCRAGYAAFLLEVKDTGIGMNRDFVDSMIFKPFQRDETQYVSKTEGNGIGMSITKEILDVMGADMQIESEVGKGSVFRIHMSLKIDSGAAGKEQEEKSDVPNLTGKRLLVVEDNEINMEIIEFLLKRTEAEVVTAWNAEDALRIFDESPEGYFDLIFFDIQLPGMSGYEAVKILRAKNRGDALRVPVWAMTANAFSQDVEQSMQSGMNDHISKPIDTDVLYRKLKDAL